MKGAKAELPPKTINAPKISKTRMSGINHNFLRSTKNLNISFKKSINRSQILFAIWTCFQSQAEQILKIQNY